MSEQRFRKLLVANRGEIAIRVFRAATELGIRTVAVYTHEDRYSLHRYKADEAYLLKPESEPLRPYLDIEGIVKLAKKKEVDAIHPGYGFLSENVAFARACREHGIKFIGPEPEVMERLGDKVSAREVAQEVGVPVIQGSEQPLDSLEVALAEAQRIGFPVLIKAAAGGGGRGMRICRNAEDMRYHFDAARNEAEKAFGSGKVFLEQYIANPKHIEVQLLGDEQGNLVHLFERDCSVQRRFQKVVEVAPASTLQQQTRQQLHTYALQLAQHVNYSNAGTAEFLVDEQENVYFIEVNPRIQVEHTITEEITGVDLVRSQILIAEGKPLDHPKIYLRGQQAIECHGHAIQCRITTEDPANDFQPDYGRIIAYRNAAGMGIRLDEGSSYPGVTISPFFDSMLVKVSAWGRTLPGAASRLERALQEFRIRGVKTNIPFLRNVIRHPEFTQGKATVNFIQQHPKLLEYPLRQDRGTRALRFLGDVIVNGNPDVKYRDPNKVFLEPHVPQFDPYAPYPTGSKDRLNQLGAQGLAQWLKSQQGVQYTDTTFRDAHQSLLATRVRTRDMLRVAEGFAKANPEIFSMEVWGGATFDVCMRFLHEDPWKRLQLFRQAMPNLLLQMLIRSSNAVGYTAYPDNLVERFIEKAWSNGVDLFRIFDSLNWLDNMELSIRTVRQRTGGIAEACVCYTGDITDPSRDKYTLNYYLDFAKRLEDAGAHILGIKDMAGLLKPDAAELLITRLKASLDIPIHLHTHDTSAVQPATYLRAVEAGVDAVDVALGAMSGLTSQPNFNSVASMLRGHPRQTPVNLDSLNAYSNYWETVRNYYYPFESGLKAGTAEVYEHEIPGGQYSNLRPQARGLGLEEQFDTIKANYAIANRLFGDLIKVTPSSKVVGDMAMFMTANGYTEQDILERGDSISFPESVINFFKGDLGQPVGGFPSELQKIILKDQSPYTNRPNEHLQPVDFETDFQAFQQEFGDSVTELDFLSYKLYPKVYRDFHAHREEFGDVMPIPTPAFFYGLEPNEEILLEIEEGKNLLIRYLNTGAPDAEGYRTVFFQLNGQNRSVRVQDKSLGIETVENEKVSGPGDIGAPLQGKLVNILVEPGQAVEKNTPLFVIEAMKMESTVTAPQAGVVEAVVLASGAMVEQDDVVVRIHAG